MINKQQALPQVVNSGEEILRQLIDKLSMPNGFSKLNTHQRRLLLTAVLCSVIPADGHVRKVEMDHLEKHLQEKFRFTKDQMATAIVLAKQNVGNLNIQSLAQHLPELLSIEDRTNLVGMLWDIALCDHELHHSEEALVYKISDAAGVLRKRVTEQQAIAASRNGLQR